MFSRYNAYKFIASAISPYFSDANLVNILKDRKIIDWELVALVASNHSIIQALYPALLSKGLIDHVPDEFISYIKEMNRLNNKRNRLMRSQLMEAVSIINTFGVRPLLMKGAAHYFLDTFVGDGDRLLTDLDILVPKEKIKLVSDGLIKSGYKYVEEKMEFMNTHHHYPPLIRDNDCAMIELHRDLMFHKQQHVFPTELAWGKAIDIILPNNSRAKVLSPTYRVFHSFLHSNIVDKLYQKGCVEIRQLHELARTQFVYSSDINWNEIFDHTQKYGANRQLYANLYSAIKFMGFPKLKEVKSRHLMSSIFQHQRVCSKLKYHWFDSLDKKLQRRFKHFTSDHKKPVFAP